MKEELFNNMIKAMEKHQELELQCLIAKLDYEEAIKAYKASLNLNAN